MLEEVNVCCVLSTVAIDYENKAQHGPRRAI